MLALSEFGVMELPVLRLDKSWGSADQAQPQSECQQTVHVLPFAQLTACEAAGTPQMSVQAL
jgi:hypothetical protein